MRALIKEADPEAVEEWKWRGVPVWSHGGILCTGETYKAVVKLTFAKGAALDDPSSLFNSSLEGSTRRAIDIHEGDDNRRGGAEGAHSRRCGAEYVKASRRSPGPFKEVKDGPMTQTATETRTVVVEREIPYAPEKIWRALTSRI